MDEAGDYDATLNWAIEEEKLRATRVEGYGSFYLIIGAIFILIFCLLILFYANRGRKDGPTALEMMQDEENILFEEFSNLDEDDEIQIEEIKEDEIKDTNNKKE